MTITNFEKFITWYNENAKAVCLNPEALLEEVIRQHGETGSAEYEMSAFESKDSTAHLYRYNYSFVWNEEDDWMENEAFEF